MGLIPEDIIAEVRNRTDIAQVIGEQVALTRAGAQLRGLCPFHAERTPSFFVYPQKQFFICYGCGKKGDVFRFLMEQQARTFVDVVREDRAPPLTLADATEATRIGIAVTESLRTGKLVEL